MKLCYRGISHSDLSKTMETVESEATAQFMGKTYKVRRPIYQPHQAKLNLVYRGVAYSTGESLDVPPQSSVQMCPFVAQLTEHLGIQQPAIE
jgi:hypothetical protein